MTTTSILRAAVSLALAVASSFAADITGKWHGTIHNTKYTDPDPVDFEFRQFGDRIVGVEAVIDLKPRALKEGKVANGHLTFEIPADGLFDLTISGDEMRGRTWATGEHGEMYWGPFDVVLKREVNFQPGPFTGTWVGRLGPEPEALPIVMVLRQDGSMVSGTMGGAGPFRQPLGGGRVIGQTLIFAEGHGRMELTLDGNKLTGALVAMSALPMNLVRAPEEHRWDEVWVGNVWMKAEDGFVISVAIILQLDGSGGECIYETVNQTPLPGAAFRDGKIEFDIKTLEGQINPQLTRMHFKLTRTGDELSGVATSIVDGKQVRRTVTGVLRFK